MKSISQITINILIFFLFLLSFLPAIAQQSGPPPSIKPGLEINRSMLIKKITAFDSTMVFKQNKDIDQLPNFIGLNTYSSTIQLIAQDDDLKLAKYTIVVSTDQKIMLREFTGMGNFSFIMSGQKGADWLKENIIAALRNQTKLSEVKNFDFNRKGEIIYLPESKIFILSFTEW